MILCVRIVAVRMALFCMFQTHNQTNYSSSESTGTRLTDLNDDCLLEIFSLHLLDLQDFCSLAETCKRFREIVSRNVPKDIEFERKSHGDRIITRFDKYGDKVYQSETISKVFKNFGSMLKEVSIDNGCINNKSWEFLINLVAHHCEDDLKTLSIRNAELTHTTALQLRPIFKSLERLFLHRSRSVDDSAIFTGLDELVDLRIAWVANCEAILKNTFPKLEVFEYVKDGDNADVPTFLIIRPDNELCAQPLMDFIQRHPTLKELSICFDCGEKTATKILEVIVNSCKDLEKLYFNGGEEMSVAPFQPIYALKSLTSLEMGMVYFEDFDFFSPLRELRELRFLFCNLPEDTNQFATLSQLTKLKIQMFDNLIDIVGIIRCVTNLEEFTIGHEHNDFGLDEETLSRIVAVVKGRSNQITLKCNYDVGLKSQETGNLTLLPIVDDSYNSLSEDSDDSESDSSDGQSMFFY